MNADPCRAISQRHRHEVDPPFARHATLAFDPFDAAHAVDSVDAEHPVYPKHTFHPEHTLYAPDSVYTKYPMSARVRGACG